MPAAGNGDEREGGGGGGGERGGREGKGMLKNQTKVAVVSTMGGERRG